MEGRLVLLKVDIGYIGPRFEGLIQLNTMTPTGPQRTIVTNIIAF